MNNSAQRTSPRAADSRARSCPADDTPTTTTLVPDFLETDKYLNSTDVGRLRQFALTALAIAILRRRPQKVSVTREQVARAAKNKDRAAAEQGVCEIAADSTENAWSEILAVVRAVINEVEPWEKAAKDKLARVDQALKYLPNARRIRVGSWRESFMWSNTPTFIGIAFYATLMMAGVYAETICGMLYVGSAWPDVCASMVETCPWLTVDLAAWALSFGFIGMPIAILKSVPATQHHRGRKRFYVGFRSISRLLIFAGPVVFSWVLFAAKHEPTFINGEMSSPPLNPTLLGYVCAAMFLLLFGSTACVMFIQELVDKLFTITAEQHPETELAEEERQAATICLSSCSKVRGEVEMALKAANAAAKSLEARYLHELRMLFKQIDARAEQAYLDES